MSVFLKRQGWSDEAAHYLAGATGSDPSYTIEELRKEVQAGRCNLFLVIEESEQGRLDRLGFVVLWVDNFGASPELVVQAGVSFEEQAGALKKTMPALVQVMKDSGCASMRVHVEGRARVNLFEKNGFAVAETVLRFR